MNNLLEVFKVPFEILKLFGLWQNKDSSFSYRLYGFIMYLAFVFLYMFFMLLYVPYIDDLQSLTDCMSTLLTNVALNVKTINFLYNLSSIASLKDSVGKLIEASDCETIKNHDQVQKYVKQAWSIFKAFTWSAVVACSLGGLAPLFNIKEHKLAYKMHFPMLDPENSDFTFVLLCIYQLTPIFSCCVTTSLDMLPVFFMCFAAGMFKELSIRLEKIGGKKTVKEITANPQLLNVNKSDDVKELLKCIEIHQEIRKLVDETQRIFSGVIMFQGLMSSIIFCSAAFMLSMVRNI